MTQPNPNPDPGRHAADQAAEYGSIFEPTTLVLDDGTTITVPPHPALRLLDDDALAELDRLDFEVESYDRHPDVYIPERKGKDRNGDEITLPAEIRPGALKVPYRRTDPDSGETVLMTPPFDVQQVKIVLGEDAYAKLRSATVNGKRGSAAHIKSIWRKQGAAIERRQASDSKSDDRVEILEDVATPDRVGPEPVSPPADR